MNLYGKQRFTHRRPADRAFAMAPFLAVLSTSQVLCDAKASGGAAEGAPAAASSGGVAYLAADVPTDVPPDLKRNRVLCYTLKSLSDSATQHFILEPAPPRR